MHSCICSVHLLGTVLHIPRNQKHAGLEDSSLLFDETSQSSGGGSASTACSASLPHFNRKFTLVCSRLAKANVCSDKDCVCVWEATPGCVIKWREWFGNATGVGGGRGVFGELDS